MLFGNVHTASLKVMIHINILIAYVRVCIVLQIRVYEMNKAKVLNEFIDGVGPLTGADVLLEDLRQICIFKKYSSDHWWEYIANFPDDCFTGDIEKCSEKAMVASSVSQQTIKDCVDSSFIGDEDINKANENSLLRAETDAFLQKGIIVWPAVLINNITYRVYNIEICYIIKAFFLIK